MLTSRAWQRGYEMGSRVLVVGGAGYVGSAACAWLLDHGHEPWVLDDLSRGHRELVLDPGKLTIARAGDSSKVEKLLSERSFDCVMHFAAYALVAESVAEPAKYQENNVEQTHRLLSTLLKSGPKKFVFSSTCAVYGDPSGNEMTEDLAKHPVNPYGETKLEVERMLKRLAYESGLQSFALRYFNAAGAERKLRVGEWHEPESHLIPNVLESARTGKPVEIFGDNYPTPDGTCVRDYVHVTDLAVAHLAAMDKLLGLTTSNGFFDAYNVGSGVGHSVKEVVSAAERVTGRKIATKIVSRRPGDPPRLVANVGKAQRELKFHAEFGLNEILETAWEWECAKTSRFS